MIANTSFTLCCHMLLCKWYRNETELCQIKFNTVMEMTWAHTDAHKSAVLVLEPWKKVFSSLVLKDLQRLQRKRSTGYQLHTLKWHMLLTAFSHRVVHGRILSSYCWNEQVQRSNRICNGLLPQTAFKAVRWIIYLSNLCFCWSVRVRAQHRAYRVLKLQPTLHFSAIRQALDYIGEEKLPSIMLEGKGEPCRDEGR